MSGELTHRRRFLQQGIQGDVFRAAFEFIGIVNDIDRLGLRAIKIISRKRLRKAILKAHPDSGGRGHLYKTNRGGSWTLITIKTLVNWKDLICGLKYTPETPKNLNQVLHLQKGFKTTNDVDFGLNGPA